jgi:uncharacterized surface protein with fasciclin (FAS1) repeats
VEKRQPGLCCRRKVERGLKRKIKEGKGTAELTTVEGGKLWISLPDGQHIMLKDEKGGTALVTISNVSQSNGVIRVIDGVMPN